MWFVVLFLSRRRKRRTIGFWQVYFLQGGFANNKPTIASQDLMIQCLENDMSLFFFQIHHFLDLMLLEAMVVEKSILMIL
jgi:hypothetical protein